MNDNRRIVAWPMDDGSELMGRFMKFMALHDNYGNITAHALVEMNDGRVWILDLDVTDIRFLKEDCDNASRE